VAALVTLASLLALARPAFAHVGLLAFLSGTDWDPVAGSFGALPFIYGTLVTSALALGLAVPVALGLSLFLTELAPARVRALVLFGVELLSGIPSVVYGLWGLFVVVPWLREVGEPALGRWLGFVPLFQGAPLGMGYLAAALILAVMVLPTVASVTVEVMKTVPSAQREAALALGATRWEMLQLAVLPHARKGVLGASMLGLGRALGETMAVTMVIGNQPEIHASLFAPGYTLSSIIANEFAEATDASHAGALAALAIALFGITLLMNAGARLLVGSRAGGAS
jgi:phosphate transport system permease protein